MQLLAVGCRLCKLMIFNRQMSLVLIWNWLSRVGFGCRVMIVNCWVSVMVVGSMSSGVSCRVLNDDCRGQLTLTFSIVGAQL